MKRGRDFNAMFGEAEKSRVLGLPKIRCYRSCWKIVINSQVVKETKDL